VFAARDGVKSMAIRSNLYRDSPALLTDLLQPVPRAGRLAGEAQSR